MRLTSRYDIAVTSWKTTSKDVITSSLIHTVRTSRSKVKSTNKISPSWGKIKRYQETIKSIAVIRSQVGPGMHWINIKLPCYSLPTNGCYHSENITWKPLPKVKSQEKSFWFATFLISLSVSPTVSLTLLKYKVKTLYVHFRLHANYFVLLLEDSWRK